MNNREEQYRSFIESAPMAVAMLDTDLHYLAVSDQWHRQYHLEEDRDLIGEHHYNVFPEIRDMPGASTGFFFRRFRIRFGGDNCQYFI